jgi:hypothetical protein
MVSGPLLLFISLRENYLSTFTMDAPWLGWCETSPEYAAFTRAFPVWGKLRLKVAEQEVADSMVQLSEFE